MIVNLAAMLVLLFLLINMPLLVSMKVVSRRDMYANKTIEGLEDRQHF